MFICGSNTMSGWRAASKESRTVWRKICYKLNACMKSNKTVEKCVQKIKYLIQHYKDVKEWSTLPEIWDNMA